MTVGLAVGRLVNALVNVLCCCEMFVAAIHYNCLKLYSFIATCTYSVLYMYYEFFAMVDVKYNGDPNYQV